jgi:GrpB-like predicted nucleotidyltransferase (UPF0157 family)
MALAVRVAGRELHTASGNVALRIDHTGSISVPGPAAKPIIDVQISVASFELLSAFRDSIESCGVVLRPHTGFSRSPPLLLPLAVLVAVSV